MQVSNDSGLDITINKGLGKLEMFSEDVESSITSDETDERDCPIRDVVQLGQFELWRWQDWDKANLLEQLQGGLAFEAAVAMISIVEELEFFGLGSEVSIATKPLGSEESPIIGIIKALHSSITPRFSNGNEDHFDPQQQAEPQDDAKRTRVTIAAPKTELVVDLEKIGNSHDLPTADQALSHGLVVFPSLGMKKDPVAVKIHDIERIEPPIALDVSWSKEICLMDVVEIQGLCEIRVFDTLGDIGGFF